MPISAHEIRESLNILEYKKDIASSDEESSRDIPVRTKESKQISDSFYNGEFPPEEFVDWINEMWIDCEIDIEKCED